MRITGGETRGRKIKIPPGIRPTQEKVRAAIFDVLGPKINNARFIDLFAGSGSVGIEALSRGARETVFIEHSRKIIQVLKTNLKSLNYLDKSKIITTNVLTFGVNSILPNPTIIFADPPYNKGLVKKVIELCAEQSLLVIEHSAHEELITGKHYKFGDTIVTFI